MENSDRKKHSVFVYLSFFCMTVILVVPLFLMVSMVSSQPNMPSWDSYFQILWSSLVTNLIPFNFILPFIGVTAGILAVKYGRKTESVIRVKFSTAITLINSILLLIPLLYLIPLFIPRTISGVITYKHNGHDSRPSYICVKNSAFPPESERVDLIYIAGNTYIYEQYEESSNQKQVLYFNSIQSGQVVRVEYYGFHQFGFITARSVTILKSQFMEYDKSTYRKWLECNDGHLDSFPIE